MTESKKMTRKQKKLCYVIMPFSDHVGIKEEEWTEVYDNIFRRAIEGSGFGYKCNRSEITAGSFTKEIVENMKNAHVVLADITGFNGNVMWELGVRHALSPRTIMVARDKILDTKVISDLKIYGVHTYDNNAGAIAEFKIKIKNSLKKIEENPDRPDNPVFDFLKIEDLVLSSFERKQILNRLVGLENEILENLRIANGIIDKKIKATKDFVTFYRFSHYAIEYYLINNYISINDDFQKNLHATLLWLLQTNTLLELLNSEMGSGKEGEIRRIEHAESIHKFCKTFKPILEDRLKNIEDCISRVKSNEVIVADPVIFRHPSPK